MDIAQKIKATAAYGKMAMKDLAVALEMTPQALYQRLKTGKFSSAELEQIAGAIGVKYVAYFEFQDGTRI